jgi:hypothetical protein
MPLAFGTKTKAHQRPPPRRHLNMLRHRGYDSLIAFLGDHHHGEIVRTTHGLEIV